MKAEKFFRNYLIEYNSQYNSNGATIYIYTYRMREREHKEDW